MANFNDVISTIEERNTERMGFRTKPHIKRAIQRAAALSGVDDSVFTMNAAYQAALETIEQHERTVLRPEDIEAFFEAIENPKPPTEHLIKAVERYRKHVISK